MDTTTSVVNATVFEKGISREDIALANEIVHLTRPIPISKIRKILWPE